MSEDHPGRSARRDGATTFVSDLCETLPQFATDLVGGRRVAIPAVTAVQMREVDRIVVEDVRIELVQMMENAGRNLAELVLQRLPSGSIMVLAGPGGNGGGGLVAARHLSNRGRDVAVTLSTPASALRGVPGEQLDIVRRMGIPVTADPRPAEVVVDALLGYGLKGSPRARTAELITWANASGSRVVALDVPSGLDATSGIAAEPCVRAWATLTLALPKVGLAHAAQVGELFLADISVPALVYRHIGVSVPPLFDELAIIPISRCPVSAPAASA